MCTYTYKRSYIMNEYQLDDDLIYILSEFYKNMSDPTRMKIIYALTVGELCVQDISNIIKMNQTAVSYQLRILRAARLVKNERRGKMIFYSINDEHVRDIINLTIEHLGHDD